VIDFRRASCALRSRSAPSAQRSVSLEASTRRFSVLVVEDHRATADAVAGFLRAYGYDTRVAYDAEQGMTIFRQWHADAAVLDIVMKGIDGIDLARRLRQMATRPLLLVALTGLGTPDEIAPLCVSDFDHFLLKPVHPDELLQTLGSLVSERTSPSA